MKSRRGFAIQRLMNAMRQAHADGWFIVFDTLTLADDRLETFYDNPNALRDYFRDIGRMVLAAEGRKANDSHADCYQYFCVPEYGTANGRLHFHAVHFMRTLPTGSVDPNFGRRVRNRRQLNSLLNTWPYGYSMPIAVRYTQDAFSRSGWLWPVDAKGEPLKATSYMAVGLDRKSGSAGMPRPISYAVFCLKKKNNKEFISELSCFNHVCPNLPYRVVRVHHGIRC